MSKRMLTIKRSLVLLALGGSTFALFGTNFGPAGFGCNYANNSDYATWYTTSGQAAVQTVSDGIFGFLQTQTGDPLTDLDTFIWQPGTNFAQATWANWVDARVPDDLPNNTVVQR